ncbi:astacin-like metalloendopeptidase isoform X2 [Mugil cephalus]|uniref:astacin-like metalloendopeptidase isoform X2 n=1 Tax=Mugil cephalus TaxID=48193 RepID=UPI001FB5F807|nr:astacin-like metalloendopeptidase isoform X2 [Mugil cephalus]
MKELEASVCVLSPEEIMNLLFVVVVFVFQYLKVVNSSPLPEATQVLRKDLLLKVVHYMESNPETLEELLNKNHRVLEGDMILRTNRNVVGETWPTLEIPYVISPDLASKKHEILSAMELVSKQTCVTFHQRTTEEDYLMFVTSKGCASYVGIIGGEQPVMVAPQCSMGNIAHEILHALGFHHEHTRMDRDEYITVFPQNIMPGMEMNFGKFDGVTFDLPYDITSIMHYGSQPTIVANKEEKDMGQRVRMTEMDVERVRRLYQCDSLKHPSGNENVNSTEEEKEKKKKEKDVNMHIMAHELISDQKH